MFWEVNSSLKVANNEVFGERPHYYTPHLENIAYFNVNKLCASTLYIGTVETNLGLERDPSISLLY
jgi:hypothetical protein